MLGKGYLLPRRFPNCLSRCCPILDPMLNTTFPGSHVKSHISWRRPAIPPTTQQSHPIPSRFLWIPIWSHHCKTFQLPVPFPSQVKRKWPHSHFLKWERQQMTMGSYPTQIWDPKFSRLRRAEPSHPTCMGLSAPCKPLKHTAVVPGMIQVPGTGMCCALVFLTPSVDCPLGRHHPPPPTNYTRTADQKVTSPTSTQHGEGNYLRTSGSWHVSIRYSHQIVGLFFFPPSKVSVAFLLARA